MLYQLFIFKVHFFYDFLYGYADTAFFCLIEFCHINGFAVFDDYMSLFDPGEMILPDLAGVVDTHGYDGTTCLLGDLKASTVERKKNIRFRAAGALRENADGDTGVHLFDSFQNCLHSLFDICPVKKKTV